MIKHLIEPRLHFFEATKINNPTFSRALFTSEFKVEFPTIAMYEFTVAFGLPLPVSTRKI
jgi:hypothetical protein